MADGSEMLYVITCIHFLYTEGTHSLTCCNKIFHSPSSSTLQVDFRFKCNLYSLCIYAYFTF